MRSMWYEFPEEEALFTEEKQWMLGNALLIRPIVEKDSISATVNLPGADKVILPGNFRIFVLEHKMV